MRYSVEMWFFIVFFCVFRTGVESIRLVSMQVPDKVDQGEEVQLKCKYDLEGDRLYMMKWIKDNSEFFRYTPSENPQKQYFPLQGVDVDMARSGNDTVIIKDVVANTSGTFTCEVSADVSFHTVMEEKTMAVRDVFVPDNGGSASPRPLVTWNYLCASILSFLFFQSIWFQTSFDTIRVLRSLL